jgi:hypothetical protein
MTGTHHLPTTALAPAPAPAPVTTAAAGTAAPTTPTPSMTAAASPRSTAATTTATPAPAPVATSGSLDAAVVGAGAVVVGALLLALWNVMLARRKSREEERARQRTAFAEALQAVAAYKEMPYAIRRRNAGERGAERVRLSEAVREIQAELLFHQTWIRGESTTVADTYDALVAAARRVAGGAMRDAWNADPITTDAEMNIGPELVDLSELRPLEQAFTAATVQHLARLTPWWCR